MRGGGERKRGETPAPPLDRPPLPHPTKKKPPPLPLSPLSSQSIFLQALGIQPLDFCFMAAVAPGIMGVTAEQASRVAKYTAAAAQGAGALATVLRDHPKLLEYDFDPERGVLAKPARQGGVGGAPALAAVDSRPGGMVGVSFFREGATFNTAPVSPFHPNRVRRGVVLDVGPAAEKKE